MVVTMGDVLSFRTGLSSDGAAILAGKVATIVTNATDVSTTDNTVTIADHGFITGDKVTWGVVPITGTTVTGLVDATGYWIIKVDNNIFSLASSAANAAAGTAKNLTSVGAGGGTFTLTNYTVSETTRNPIGVAIHDVDAKETEQPLAVQLFTGGGILLIHVDGNLNGAIAVGDTVGVATDSHTGQKGGLCSLGIATEACGAAEDRLINVLV
jgi:hypothetical protein